MGESPRDLNPTRRTTGKSGMWVQKLLREESTNWLSDTMISPDDTQISKLKQTEQVVLFMYRCIHGTAVNEKGCEFEVNKEGCMIGAHRQGRKWKMKWFCYNLEKSLQKEMRGKMNTQTAQSGYIQPRSRNWTFPAPQKPFHPLAGSANSAPPFLPEKWSL